MAKPPPLGTIWPYGAKFQVIGDDNKWKTVSTAMDTPYSIGNEFRKLRKQGVKDIWVKHAWGEREYLGNVLAGYTLPKKAENSLMTAKLARIGTRRRLRILRGRRRSLRRNPWFFVKQGSTLPTNKAFYERHKKRARGRYAESAWIVGPFGSEYEAEAQIKHEVARNPELMVMLNRGRKRSYWSFAFKRAGLKPSEFPAALEMLNQRIPLNEVVQRLKSVRMLRSKRNPRRRSRLSIRRKKSNRSKRVIRRIPIKSVRKKLSPKWRKLWAGLEAKLAARRGRAVSANRRRRRTSGRGRKLLR